MFDNLDPKIVLIILAANVVLSAASGLLGLFAKPDSTGGKIAGWIKKIVDFVSANVAHK